MTATFYIDPPKVGKTFCIDQKVYKVLDKKKEGREWKVKVERVKK